MVTIETSNVMNYSQATKGPKTKERKQITEEEQQIAQVMKTSLKEEHEREMKTHWEEEKQIKQAKRNSTDDLICQTFLNPNLRTEEEKLLANHLVFNQNTKTTLDGKQANSAQPSLAQLKQTLT